MNWESFAKKVEANLDKVRAEVAEHNALIDSVLHELNQADEQLRGVYPPRAFEQEQRVVLLAQLAYMRLMLEKERISGWE